MEYIKIIEWLKENWGYIISIFSILALLGLNIPNIIKLVSWIINKYKIFIEVEIEPVNYEEMPKDYDREAYKRGDKSKIVNIPDLILIDFGRSEIINVEGKNNLTLILDPQSPANTEYTNLKIRLKTYDEKLRELAYAGFELIISKFKFVLFKKNEKL